VVMASAGTSRLPMGRGAGGDARGAIGRDFWAG
jgi:hypothetical protein